MDADKLYLTDQKQIEAKYSFYIKPNIFVVSALENARNVFIYYKLTTFDENIQDTDIRYIRDNGKILGMIDIDNYIYFKYVNDHKLEETLGNRISVFQEIFSIKDSLIKDINDHNIFPNVSELVEEDLLLGYKLKYNVTERFYFLNNDNKKIIRIYDYDISYNKEFNTTGLSPIIVFDKKFYKVVD